MSYGITTKWTPACATKLMEKVAAGITMDPGAILARWNGPLNGRAQEIGAKLTTTFEVIDGEKWCADYADCF